MLAGHNNVSFPARFAANIANYSDDSQTLNGAYGFRWRHHFASDQIQWVIQHLGADQDSRRAVIVMWDPSVDMHGCNVGSKDVPCNTTVYFRRDAKTKALNMTVSNRSNDIVWGCYGANAVHMSMLHEFVADSLHWEVGTYVQFSNNWHVYPIHYKFIEEPFQEDGPVYDNFQHVKLGSGHSTLDSQEFREFVNGKRDKFHNQWLNKVGVPVILCHEEFKVRGATDALKLVDNIHDQAVWSACSQWLERRQ